MTGAGSRARYIPTHSPAPGPDSGDSHRADPGWRPRRRRCSSSSATGTRGERSTAFPPWVPFFPPASSRRVLPFGLGTDPQPSVPGLMRGCPPTAVQPDRQWQGHRIGRGLGASGMQPRPPGARGRRRLGPRIDQLPPLARATPLGFARRVRSWAGCAQMGEIPHPLLVHATGVVGVRTGAVLMTAPDEDQEHSRPGVSWTGGRRPGIPSGQPPSSVLKDMLLLAHRGSQTTLQVLAVQAARRRMDGQAFRCLHRYLRRKYLLLQRASLCISCPVVSGGF